MTRRILFLYLTKHSGHYSAAVAIESAMRGLDVHARVDAAGFVQPCQPRALEGDARAYLAALKTAPEIWEWMYDNPGVQRAHGEDP